jgi:deuterolysin
MIALCFHTLINNSDSKVQFSGIRLYVSTKGLDESAFRVIAPGESIKTSFDIAEAHDVSAGGSFDVLSEGAISYAEADSTDLVGAVTFKSNVISTKIDGPEAAATRRSYLSKVKRTAVQSDCTGDKSESLLKALAICHTRAAAAAAAAQTNDVKMIEYFKINTTSVRTTVAGVFERAAAECANSTAGVSKQYCTDQSRNCGGGVIAYTFPAQSYIVNCPVCLIIFRHMRVHDKRCN